MALDVHGVTGSSPVLSTIKLNQKRYQREKPRSFNDFRAFLRPIFEVGKKISKRVLAKSMDLNLYPRHFEPLFRGFFGKAALFCPRQNVEFEQAFLLVLLDRHSECMCHCVDTGKAQNTLGGFKMTIENARALQEQLANEVIAQLRKNGNNELVDDCIQSIAVVGKA